MVGVKAFLVFAPFDFEGFPVGFLF